MLPKETGMSDNTKDLPEVSDPLYAPPASEAPKASSGSAVDLPEFGVPLEASVPSKPKVVEDTFQGAIKMAFVGAGQGGGRIAQAFYDMGYRRVCAVNTTPQDLSSPRS